MISDPDERAPFLVPFFAALLSGIPASVLQHHVSSQSGLFAAGITILIGLSCGLGARFAGLGSHPAGAAIIATATLLLINVAITALHMIAVENGQSIPAALSTLVSSGNFKDFADECVTVAGGAFRAWIRYAIAFLVAYQVSDGS